MSWDRAAANYISRYAPNTRRLRQFLERRGAEPAEIEEIVAKAVRLGIVDDEAWAASKARRMIGRGVAPAVARQRLRAQGVDGGAAIETIREEQGDPELLAAQAYARRRRLGPWRAEQTPETRAADLAKMGRAGFSWAVAVQVIDARP